MKRVIREESSASTASTKSESISTLEARDRTSIGPVEICEISSRLSIRAAGSDARRFRFCESGGDSRRPLGGQLCGRTRPSTAIYLRRHELKFRIHVRRCGQKKWDTDLENLVCNLSIRASASTNSVRTASSSLICLKTGGRIERKCVNASWQDRWICLASSR